ncbi:MAG: DUF1330 domain-containing protein [Myxococcota bacterium]
MIYALNFFDLAPGAEDAYRRYMRETAPLLEGLDAQPVVAGHPPVRTLSGEGRQYLVVMRFGSLDDFETLMERQAEAGVGHLRERATRNYSWTVFREWDVASWLEAEGPTAGE